MSSEDPARPDPEGQEEPTPEEDLLTRQTTVREVWQLFAEKPVVVPEDADLHEVALLGSERRGVHTVAVVDKQGRLSGVIPLRLLLDELFLHVAPEEILGDVMLTGNVEELGKISRAGTAGEFMQRPAYVTMDDTVKEIFVRMHANNLEGLPIVNEEMRPVGYVGRFELLQVWLRTHPRHAGGT